MATESTPTPKLGKEITVGCINIGGSLYSQKGEKITEIKKVIEDENPEILFLQETEQKDVDEKCLPRFDEYITYCPKKMTPKTRILCLIKEDLNHKIRTDLMKESCSSIWVECATETGQKTIIGGYYREWDDLDRTNGKTPETQKSIDQMAIRFETFLTQLKQASSENKQVVFIGDLNLDKNKWAEEGWNLKRMSNRLQEELTANNMQILDHGITRRRADLNGKISQSALDIAGTNKLDKMIRFSKSNWHTWTDHCTITITINIGMHKQKQQEYYHTRQLTKIINNQEEFKRRLSKIDWEKLVDMDHVNDCVIFYSEKVHEVIDRMAPMKRKKLKKRPKVKLPPSIIRIMEEKKEIQKQNISNPSPHMDRKLREIKGQCRKLIYQEQMKTVNNMIKEGAKLQCGK